MELTIPIALTTPIEAISGVGPRRAAAFRRLGIRCVSDLVQHLPLRYEHERAEQSIREATEAIPATEGSAATVTLRGEIAKSRVVRGRKTRVEALLEDESGTLLLTWFNAPWIADRLVPGTRVEVTGRAQRHGDSLQIVNPRLEPVGAVVDGEIAQGEDGASAGGEPTDGAPQAPRDRYRPIYPATEELSSRVIERVIDSIIAPALALIDDHLPEAYRVQRALPALAEAYRMAHHPSDVDEAAAGRRRLAFDELLLLQLAVMLAKRHRHDRLTAPALGRTPEIDRRITARFPFQLTASQRAVIDEIVLDLAQPTPMNRLLQGDVGSGKTVVALYAMLVAVAAGKQAALMAPTELLAEQHLASIRGMLEGAKVPIELLTSSLRADERSSVLDRLERDEIKILVGTHSLLTESVGFANLALVVIDEQHRFGVHQRATLRSKSPKQSGDSQSEIASERPHVLVMTATPIPRTLSLTLFGDLDCSTIRDLPPGRRPVVTRHVLPLRRDEVYGLVAERIAKGEQAYVVVPAVDAPGAGLRDIQSHLEYLGAGPLRTARLAAIHGRLDRAARETIMDRFRAGEIDVLVATTVIEVGVDVPNASIMVIEQAEQFGLAQLHQLRGRVGRGGHESACILVTEPVTEEARARIDAIESTSDGFAIAERDLEIRGPGELFGSRQSGLPPFRVAELPRDADHLRLARLDAREWIDRSPTLADAGEALLRKRILKAYGEALGLGDVG